MSLINPFRRTKIVATLGPASSTSEVITELVKAGVDTFRLNFSHGTIEEHLERARQVRAASAASGTEVALMGDLQGPKIRIRGFRNGSIQIAAGDPLVLDCEMDSQDGNQDAVGVDFDTLPESVASGDTQSCPT